VGEIEREREGGRERERERGTREKKMVPARPVGSMSRSVITLSENLRNVPNKSFSATKITTRSGKLLHGCNENYYTNNTLLHDNYYTNNTEMTVVPARRRWCR